MQHLAAMKLHKHLLTILLLAVSVRGFINIQETCTDDYCENVIERHDAEKYYSEEEKEEIISSDTDINEQAVDADTENADIYKQAVDADTENAVEIDTNFESLETQDIDDEIDKSWEFPTLHRIDPGNIGDEVQLELEPGQFYTRITKAIRPPIFVIPSFLSDEECDYIIQSAINNGLNISNLFSAEIADEFSDTERDKSDISRISEQTWLSKSNLGAEFLTRLHSRVSKLTELPEFVLKSSEPIQVVSYAPGGHYHAHLDTTNHAYDRPCCIQQRCGEKEFTTEWSECCRLCRFITVLYYLNDVEEGGETAFPIADMSDELVDEKFVNLGEQEWYNLSRYCHNSSLIVKPKRGMAVMWYSHFVDSETGHLGKVDVHSHHGGCDLVKGTKWIANNWISGVPFEYRYTQSQWYNTN